MSDTQVYQVVGEHIHDGMVMMGAFPADVIEQVRDFDVTGCHVVASYPKSGTTWMQEIVWQVTSGGIPTDLTLSQRYMFMEEILPKADQDPPQKYFKTHLPVRYFRKQLDANAKIIVVMRNPKDTLVSYYNFYKMHSGFKNYKGTWDEFFLMAREKKLVHGDVIDWCEGWWKHRDNPNVLFVTYEDMLKDLLGQVKRIAGFLNQELDDARLKEITARCTFGAMKSAKTSNYQENPRMNQEISAFLRKGKSGDWKNYFTEDQSKYIDDQCKKRLEPIGIHFDFE